MFGLKHDLELLRNASMCEVYVGELGEAEMRAMWFVWTFLTGENSNGDRTIDGFSVRYTPRGARLTVKSTLQDLQQVAFVTDKNTISCVRTFARWVLEDRVKWFPDKYA